MVEEPKPEELIDIAGPAGETLFWAAQRWLFKGNEAPFQRELDETWAHYQDVTDDRLLAVIGALCIENSINALLEAIGPGVTDYREDPNFTFSVRIKVVRSLRIIPSRILTACDLVRSIRNEFAHHLGMKEFGQLDQKKYLQKLLPYVTAFDKAERQDADHRRLFRDLVCLTLIALFAYTHQIAELRRYLETKRFRAAFQEWAETR